MQCLLHDALLSVYTFVIRYFFLLDFKEGNVRLRLTVVSTEGFGDQIDKQSRYSTLYMYMVHGIKIRMLTVQVLTMLYNSLVNLLPPPQHHLHCELH